MSDMSQGPGWWVASDGKWYPPHLHPSVRVDPTSEVPVSGTGDQGHRPDPSRPPSWLGRQPKAALIAAAVLACLLAAVPTAVALSGSSSNPPPSAAPGATMPRPSGAAGTTPAPDVPSTTTSNPGPTSTTPLGPDVAGPPLSAATAQEVFDSSWPAFAVAFASGDEAGIAQYADTDVQHAITGWFGCGCGPWPTAYQKVFMSAPPETAYPLSFLAEIQERDYSQQPMVVEVVYSKPDAGSGWKISYLVSYIDAPGFLTGTTMDTPAPPSSFDVSIVGGQLASFFQTVFDTGKPPPPPTWPQTGSIAQETESLLSNLSTLKEDDLSETLSYTAGPHSDAFAIPGGDLMCGEILSHSVIRLAGSGPVVQPEDRSFLGQELAPGAYSSVTNDGVRDACWTAVDGVATPVSFMGGVYSRVGVPYP